MVLAEFGVKPVENHGGEELVKLWKGTYRSVIFWFRRAPFLVHHCDQNFSPRTGSHEVLLDDQVEDFMYHFVVSSSAPLGSSAVFPLLPVDFPFLRLPIAILSSFMENSTMCLSCSSSSRFFIIVSIITNVFKFFLCCPPHLFFHRSYLSVYLRTISQMS